MSWSQSPRVDANPAQHFQAVYRQELDYVWCTVRRLGGASSELEDLTHEVFATALRKWAEYDRSRPVRPWLFGIAYRVLTNTLRQSHRTREVASDDRDMQDPALGPEDRMAAEQERGLLLEGLAGLDPVKRAVVVMADIDGHSGPEIAEALGIPLNTAYSRLRTARADLVDGIKRLRLKRGAT